MPRLIVRAYGQLTPTPDQITSTAWEELYSVLPRPLGVDALDGLIRRSLDPTHVPALGDE